MGNVYATTNDRELFKQPLRANESAENGLDQAANVSRENSNYQVAKESSENYIYIKKPMKAQIMA